MRTVKPTMPDGTIPPTTTDMYPACLQLFSIDTQVAVPTTCKEPKVCLHQPYEQALAGRLPTRHAGSD